MDSIIKKIEEDGVEFTGGVMILAYMTGALLLLLEIVRPF